MKKIGSVKKTGQEALSWKPGHRNMTNLERIKAWFGIDSTKKHSHDRENARRRGQIDRGMLKVYEGGLMHNPMGGI